MLWRLRRRVSPRSIKLNTGEATVLPAPTFNDILARAEMAGGSRDPMCDRLVSIVFAHPASLVIRDLGTNRAFWDELTGTSWDLFFAGYYAYGGHGDSDPINLRQRLVGSETNWMFSPSRFRDVLGSVELGLSDAGIPERWRFSGGADVVSFMVYRGAPDWLTLRGVDLQHRIAASPDGGSLGRVIEGLRGWQEEEPDRCFAPGEVVLRATTPPRGLNDALRWTALAAAGGVLGNQADAIVDGLLRLLR